MRKKNQTQRVLEKLRESKRERVPTTNWELNRICFRYGARIMDLRKLKFVIETKREGVGFYSYRLISEPKNI